MHKHPYPKFNSYYQGLTPLDYQTGLPQQFSSDLTMLKKVNNSMSHITQMDRKLDDVVKYAHSVGHVTDHNIDEMMKEIDNFETEITNIQEEFETNMMEQYMPSSIQQILDEMTDDGRFQSIIEGTVVQDLSSKIDQITLNVAHLSPENRIVGDGTDESTKIQNVVLALSSAGGGIIFFPEPIDYYKILSPVYIPSNITIEGVVSKPLFKNPSDDDIPVFVLESCQNVTFKNITVTNGFNGTGNHQGASKHGIYVNSSQNIRFENCDFVNNGGYSAVSIRMSKDVYVEKCYFKDATYKQLMLFEETENIYINECEFDGATSTTLPNTYLLATGASNYVTEYDFLVRNLHITKCRFLNNPLWEGIDSHGVSGFYCKDNYIENVATGIMVGFDDRPNVPFEHRDIYIENNIIIKGSSTKYGDGILVKGNNASGKLILADNVHIKNNKIKGKFGNVENEYASAIRLDCIKNFSVLNNVISESVNRFMVVGFALYGKIKDNIFMELYPASSGNLFAVRFGNAVYFVDFENNTIKNEKNPIIQRGIYGTNKGLTILSSNDIVATTPYQTTTTLMNGTITSARVGREGIYVKNKYGIITHYNTDLYLRSTARTTSVEVSAVSGTKTITSSKSVLFDVGIGEEIVIEGAGISGADLQTVVVEYINANSFVIKDEISTSISGVFLKTLDSTWVEV